MGHACHKSILVIIGNICVGHALDKKGDDHIDHPDHDGHNDHPDHDDHRFKIEQRCYLHLYD